ncbi:MULTISPECIES: hypothetical protein [Streptomyces]|uniref:Uncharacterized protein n=2 Tax=Streptomyces TaxID=1883 RepID=A0ABS9JJU1_9ACTN|nr:MULTISPECIES: hypothetical protein [Streptomyces]MCG0065839.1 hypothetical protein [Streptomyces tricolor]
MTAMELNLPVQRVIDRRKRLEPFRVRTPFKDSDGTPSVMEHEVGGAHGHDPSDPSLWLCGPALGFGCDPAPGADWADPPDIL